MIKALKTKQPKEAPDKGPSLADRIHAVCAEAEALIAGRPYASQQAFLDKLSEKIAAADLDAAKSLLGS